MKNYNSTLFSTHDLALSAALVCKGFVIEGLEKGQTGRAAFYFSREDGLDAAVQQYWAGQLLVDPKAYFDAIRGIKTRIYSGW